MKSWFAVGFILLSWQIATAQDLVITNAQIIDGAGATIGQGSIVVAEGRIVAVTAGSPSETDGLVIDAKGMTVMPGMINTHWHVLTGVYPATSQVAVDRYIDEVLTGLFDALLARGVTTIFSAGDLFPNIVGLRDRLAEGRMRGPRLLVVGPVFTGPGDWPTPLCRGDVDCTAKATAEMRNPSQARARVREVAAAGVDALKLVYDDQIVPDVRIADEVVAAIADEARLHDLKLFAHVTTTDETALRLAELGVRGLVHPVPLGTDGEGAKRLRDLNIPVATTVSGRTREWRKFAKQDYSEKDHVNFNRRLADIRHLWDEGVTVAFGTDTTTRLGGHEERFWAEVRGLNHVLSNQEVITALTRNAAIFLGLGDKVGTLEPGKIADILLIDGDPLADLSDLANVQIVIQGGQVVVDKR
jgi:imidazolonepropionase-like amidohydrolase